MSNNFGHLPIYLSASLPAPILDVNASGLLDVTGQNSINITGPFAVVLKTTSLVGTRFYVLNSSDNTACSISLDNGGVIGSLLPDTRSRVWTINFFPRAPSACWVFRFDGTNLWLA